MKAAEFDQFQVRLPPGMRDRLRVEAATNKRSMNAEVVQRLESTLTQSTLFGVNFIQDEKKALSSRQAAMTEAEKEDELVQELLFLEQQLHRTAKQLRKLRSYRPVGD